MFVVGVRHLLQHRGAFSGGFYLFPDQDNEDWINSIDTVAGGGSRDYMRLPFGITSIDRPPSIASYEGRTYIVGGHTYNILLDEHHRVLKQGMRNPTSPPTIAGAIGSGNIGYLSWFDELTNERSPLSAGTVISDATPRTWTLPAQPPDEIFQSNGDVIYNAPQVEAQDGTGQLYFCRPGDRIGFTGHANISYSLVTDSGNNNTTLIGGAVTTDASGQLPGGAMGFMVLPVARATHIEMWLSVAGGLPRLVTRAPIGTTSVAESLAAGELGETFIGSFERFPRCTFNTIYNDRQVMAGDPDNPDVVYLSDLYLPERYSGLSFRTRVGDPVTGLLGMRDYCLIFTRDRTYVLQGYTTNDFTFRLLEQSLGSVGHQCNQIIHGSAYIWTEKGPYMYNGSWHPLSPENDFTQPRWNDGQWMRTVVDPDTNAYIVMAQPTDGSGVPTVVLNDMYFQPQTTDQPSAGSGIFVFDYTTVQPEEGGVLAPARMSMDVQNTFLNTSGYTEYSDNQAGYWYLSNKWGLGRLFVCHHATANTGESFRVYSAPRRAAPDEGSGALRVETNSDFISVNIPNFIVILGHHYMNEVGGSIVEGKAFQRIWTEVLNLHASTDGTVEAYTGDFDAYALKQLGWDIIADSNRQAVWKIPFYVDPDLGTPPNSPIQVYEPPMVFSGRGITLVITLPDLGTGAVFMGWGGAFVHGPASRHGAYNEPV